MEPEYIEEQIKQSFLADAHRYPCKTNRASDIGHPCLRKRFYERTEWENKSLMDLRGLVTVGEGMIHEDAILKRLNKAGLKITSTGASFEWKKYNIVGKIDGRVYEEDTRKEHPIEIKALGRYVFESIQAPGGVDFKTSSMYWVKGYYAQLQIYLAMSNMEEGFFVIKCRDTGRIKVRKIMLDYEYVEQLIQSVEKVNAAVASGTPPEKLNDRSVCGMCSFQHICLPEYSDEGIGFVEDPELLAKLIKHQELKALAAEYKHLDDDLKEQLEGKHMVIGDYIVSGKWIEKKGFTVEPGKSWRRKIESIKTEAPKEGMDTL